MGSIVGEAKLGRGGVNMLQCGFYLPEVNFFERTTEYSSTHLRIDKGEIGGGSIQLQCIAVRRIHRR
jgi:hypothetical protein